MFIFTSVSHLVRNDNLVILVVQGEVVPVDDDFGYVQKGHGCSGLSGFCFSLFGTYLFITFIVFSVLHLLVLLFKITKSLRIFDPKSALESWELHH